MDYSSLIATVDILYQKGLRYCVISPGSRSAPLTITFARHTGIKKIVIPDERSAAFVALGLALKTKEPTVLICTSGSAVYNYAPAVAEAFYQGVPLLLFTADRPPEWIDQQDGQTIRQTGIFGHHVRGDFTFDAQNKHDDVRWHGKKIINDAFNLTKNLKPGPVHVNFPFREPFYPDEATIFSQHGHEKIIIETPTKAVLGQHELDQVINELQGFSKILIVVGQQQKDALFETSLLTFSEKFGFPIAVDVTSNVSAHKNVIYQLDLVLNDRDKADLLPDLVITTGQSILSKKLKLFLRSHKTLKHWHVGNQNKAADVFQQLSRIIPCAPDYLFDRLASACNDHNFDQVFLSYWQQKRLKTESTLAANLDKAPGFTPIPILNQVIKALPKTIDLHLANSMSVRYINYLFCPSEPKEVFSNRGVSGIDGSNGTALGSALASNETTLLITGDLAFFYDRNSFWHQHIPANLRIIVLNDAGGGIFGLLPNSSQQPELETYFETPHSLTAKNLASESGMDYMLATDFITLNAMLPDFFTPSTKAKILEIQTSMETNKQAFKTFLDSFRY